MPPNHCGWASAGAGASTSHLLFEEGNYLLDLHIKPEEERGIVSVAGQILDRAESLRVYANSSVTVLRQMEELARTTTNELGEFQLEFPPDDNLMLTVNLEGKSVLVSALPGLNPVSENHHATKPSIGFQDRLQAQMPGPDVVPVVCGCGTSRSSHSTDCTSPGRGACATGGMHPARLRRSVPLGDDQGQVFLVTAPLNLTANLLLTVPGVLDVELDSIGATTAATQAGVPASLYDATPVNYYGTTVRQGYVTQPAVNIIGLPITQNAFGLRSSGIVAVIDTGVDSAHPALANALIPGYDFTRNKPRSRRKRKH